ncbi:MAG: hydantoinase/oxoprolinase N-terminal domain-containing protein [Geminicoccaceae bacterium]
MKLAATKDRFSMHGNVRLGVDIGGTFTDLYLDAPDGPVSLKVLTTHRAPEDGVIAGLGELLAKAGLGAADIGLVIHGTTLATNALIERKGARTALLTTEGYRDTLEIASESRFDVYDVDLDLPRPLVPGPCASRWPSAWPPTAACSGRSTSRASCG